MGKAGRINHSAVLVSSPFLADLDTVRNLSWGVNGSGGGGELTPSCRWKHKAELSEKEPQAGSAVKSLLRGQA